MKIGSFKRTIQSHIGADTLKTAFELMREGLKDGTETHKDFVLLDQRYNANTKDELYNTISHENAKTESNKIVKGAARHG